MTKSDQTIFNSRTVSTKRPAWAYGCARKGSDEERQLFALLVERMKEHAEARENGMANASP